MLIFRKKGRGLCLSCDAYSFLLGQDLRLEALLKCCLNPVIFLKDEMN